MFYIDTWRVCIGYLTTSCIMTIRVGRLNNVFDSLERLPSRKSWLLTLILDYKISVAGVPASSELGVST
jgi:hypothetical protein